MNAVDPCALLVLHVGDVANSDRQSAIMQTLIENGWTTKTGAPDYRRAMKEYKEYEDAKKLER